MRTRIAVTTWCALEIASHCENNGPWQWPIAIVDEDGQVLATAKRQAWTATPIGVQWKTIAPHITLDLEQLSQKMREIAEQFIQANAMEAYRIACFGLECAA